jgi:hypothetical protein
MAKKNYKVNGVPLDSIFEPARGAPYGTINYYDSDLGSDMGNLFMNSATSNLPNAAGVVSATGYKYQGSDFNTLFQPLGYAPGNTSRIVYLSGSGTFRPVADYGTVMYLVNLACMGGGGGGAGGNGSGGYSGGGGGGGGVAYGVYPLSAPNVSYSVGVGGSGGVGINGYSGSSSFFDYAGAYAGTGGNVFPSGEAGGGSGVGPGMNSFSGGNGGAGNNTASNGNPGSGGHGEVRITTFNGNISYSRYDPGGAGGIGSGLAGSGGGGGGAGAPGGDGASPGVTSSTLGGGGGGGGNSLFFNTTGGRGGNGWITVWY